MKTTSPLRNLIIVIMIITLCGLFPNLLKAQLNDIDRINKSNPPKMEYLDDSYMPPDLLNRQVSPAYKISYPGFFTVQVNVDGNGNNILGDAANEPSITIHPTDPERMAIGWRQFDNINSNFRQAGIAFSYDAGQTWTFPGVIDPGVFRSDPVLDSDSEGNFFYNSLTTIDGDYLCDVFKSENGGETWDDGVFAYGGDKQWMTIDKSGGIGDGNMYAYWTSYYSICEPDFFTRSADGGETWEECLSINGYPYWGTNTVDRDGNLYIGGISWNGFLVAKSSNAQNPSANIMWDFSVTVNLDGELIGFGGYQCPNPSGLLGQTIIDVDRSEGPYSGNVYLLGSVERYANNDPCDVMFSKSTNGGLSWSSPQRINNDPGTNAYQWFGTMSVAPDGRIDVIWLDTRDFPGTVYSALYYAYSMDGGESWSENFQLSDAFNPHIGWPQQDKMGDYFDMISDESGAHLAWANTFNGEQDVYYAYITPTTTGIKKLISDKGIVSFNNYPNPACTTLAISYQLIADQFVDIRILDVSGREVLNPVSEKKSAGQHIEQLDVAGLQGGIYYGTLKTEAGQSTNKILIIK